MKATGNVLAVEPFPTAVIEKQLNKGFAAAKQKLAMTGLKVLIGNDFFPTGSTVFVKGDQQFEVWAKDRLEIGAVSAILCPIDRVLFCEASNA